MQKELIIESEDSETTMNKSWKRAYIAFMFWFAMCLASSVANIVIWLIKPYTDFAYHDMPNWMIAYYAPALTVFVMPSIAIMLMVRFFHCTDCRGDCLAYSRRLQF